MPETTLCTTDDVLHRLRLQILDPYDDRIAVLDAMRVAIEEKVLELTGYTFAGGEKTEQRTNVQVGVPLLTALRPVVPMSPDPARAVKLEARSLASATYNEILADLVDPAQGKVMPLASELTPVFPPTGGLSPWARWRQPIWPVVRMTYRVTAIGSDAFPIPKSVSRAAVEWTIAAYSRPGGGAIDQFVITHVVERYIADPVPPLVMSLLGTHVRNRVSMVA